MKATVIRKNEVSVTETDWGSLQWLVSEQSAPGTHMTLGRVTFKPGESNAEHRHPNCEEILFVVEGVIEHTFPKGGRVRLEAGDCIVLPQGGNHQATNIGDTDAVTLAIYNTPDREIKLKD